VHDTILHEVYHRPIYRIWRWQTLIGLDLERVRSIGYVFQVELAYIAHRLGFKIAEIPICVADRQAGESKMNIRTQI
jgi:dolichol-phosphate mannosyltransferase